MKPVINIDELQFQESEPRGDYLQRFGSIGTRIGAKKLGYNLTVVPPGKKAVPYHNHRNNEEMFFIVEGEGLLRFGGAEYPLRKNDFIACPPGGREVAHQIINTGNNELKYLAVSTMDPVEIGEFPDSDKIVSLVGQGPNWELRHISRADLVVDYMEGEA